MLAVVLIPVALVLTLLFLLRPRKGGDNAPPLIESTSRVPLLGPCIEFASSPVKMVKRCYDNYGPVFTIPILNKRITLLVGPKAQEPFFKLGDESLSPQEEYGFMKPVFGPGVVYDANKKNRQTQFQSMANGLRTSRLKGYVSKIEMETRNYLKSWGEKGEVDLLDALSELTILTASRTLHGNDVRENMFKEVAQLYHDLDHGLTPLTVFFPNAPIKAHKVRDAARVRMVELFSKVIKSRKESNTGSDGTDILSIFMDIKYKDGTKISDEEITGLLIALLFAGQHTSCITSTWTALFICNNPKVLQKVVEEQSKIFNTENATLEKALDFDDINQMGYLHNCMREALRLCPPLILLMRRALRDVHIKIGDISYVVPKGDTVMVSPSVGMRLSEVFKDPDVFEPDRFGPEREEHKIPYAYMGFGGGMHSCMGQQFAFVQVKTILSVLFREYNIQMISDIFPEIDYKAMVVGPKGDCRVTYSKRK